MDILDNKILLELTKNSRIAVTLLAKKVRASREVVAYRINRLKREGVIREFVTEIDLEKLGFVGAAVFISIKASKEEEFKEFLRNCDFVSWVAELSGVWNFGLSIYGRDNIEIDQRFMILYNKFKNDIIDYRFTLHQKSKFFYEKYFSSVYNNKKIPGGKDIKLDLKDKIILRELSTNSRIDFVELSKKVYLTIPAVAKRIKQLEKSGIIEKYSLFVNLIKLNLFQYSLFIVNKNIQTRGKLISFLEKHPKVSFIAEYLGNPFIEFGIIVKNPYELRKTLQEIEEVFPDNRVIEVSMFQEEFFSIGPPKCVFK